MALSGRTASSLLFIAALFFPKGVMAESDPFPAQGAPEINLLWQTIQVVFALAITIVLLVGAVWVFKKILGFKRFPGIPGGAIRILEIHYLDPKKAIALVKILDRTFIVGYADSSISTLGELTPEETARLDDNRQTESSPFGNILARFTKASPRDEGN
ncbi:MAG: FliO/MopB family protein [Candidatus Latescibacterota bacterium]